MKSTIKVILVLALFCGTALADGDMGNGGFWAGDGTTTTVQNAGEGGGDMGNGGKTCPQGQTCKDGVPVNPFSVFDYVKDLLSAGF